jgi:hypothetical protein
MPTQIDITAPEGDEPETGLTTKENMLETMASTLDQKFHEYSSARENKEAEWTRAIRQYDGLWDEEDRDKIEKAFGHDTDSTPPPVNITRPKTNVAISRMQDSQFPVGGDYNFTMEPTPVPTAIAKALDMTEPDPAMQAEAAAAGIDPSQAPTPQAVAQSIIDENAEAARIMTLEIEDDLVETKYGQKARLGIEDLAVLGSVVIKGPVLSPHVRKIYQPEVTEDGETIQVLGAAVEHKPDVFRVDPRLYYPDPSARIANEIEDSFELHIMSRTKLLKLADSPAFMRSQVRKAVMSGPDNSILPNSITDTAYINSGVVVKNRYVVKEYHGPLDKQSLRDGGVIDELDYDDELAEFYGEVWICNGFVIRMSLNYLEGMEGVPYGVASWERDPSSVFGHGVPYLLRHPQRVINNAYLLLLDNASLTSGPQIVLNKEMIEPASKDGNYDISPLKVWFLTEYGADVREAMQFIDVPAQMQGISQIIDMAMQFSDMESSTPLLQQGEMPTGNNTLTGVAKVMSATNINQKRASLNWDDNITIPLVDRLYHHNMQYGDNEAAKGDQQARIGGATERIEAEQRAQELERLLGLAMSSDEFQMQINPTKGFRQLATLIRAGDILRTPEEIEAVKAEMQAQQGEQMPDPEGMKAQAAMVTAQARQAKAELDAQMAQAQLQLDQAKMQADIENSQAESLARREQAFADMQVSQDRKDVEMAKLAVAQDKSVRELANDLQITQVNNETARTKMSVDLTKFREETQIKERMGTGI